MIPGGGSAAAAVAVVVVAAVVVDVWSLEHSAYRVVSSIWRHVDVDDDGDVVVVRKMAELLLSHHTFY